MITLSQMLRRTVGALTGLFLSVAATAQTSPAWLSASAVGGSATAVAATATDAAGNTYEVGSFMGTTSIGGTTLSSVGFFDAYLAKYTPAGIVAWVRQLGSAGHDQVLDVALDAAGNVYLTGSFTGTIDLGNNIVLEGGVAASPRAFVARYSAQGAPEWVRQSSASSTKLAVGGGLGLDAAGNVYAAGLYFNDLTFGAGTISAPGPAAPGCYLASFTSTGTVRSLTTALTFKRENSSGTYRYPGLAVGRAGECYLLNFFDQPIVIGPTTYTTHGLADILVARYSAQGTAEWAQQFGGPDDDRFGKGAVDAAGNLYLSGHFTATASFGSSSFTSAGLTDAFLLKLTPTGTLQWVQTGGGPGAERWSGVVLDAAGNPYVTGYFGAGARFGSTMLGSTNALGALLVGAYTPQGQLRWLRQADASNGVQGNYLGLDGRGDIIVLGQFSGTLSAGPHSIKALSSHESFLAKLGNGLGQSPGSSTRPRSQPRPRPTARPAH